MSTKHTLLICLLLLLLGFLPSVAPAAVTIPGSLATAEGNSSIATSGLFGNKAFHSQVQIAASELSVMGLNIGDSITGVSARLNGGATSGPASSVFYSSIIVTLAEAASTISGMTTTFASNMLNPVEVFNSSYTLAAGSMPGGATPNAFGPALSFTTPYTYQGGDLIFMYTKQASTSSLTLDVATSYTDSGTLYRRLSTGSYQATSGALNNTVDVLQLQTSSVPEPSRALLLMVGVLSIVLRRRRSV